MGRRYGNKEAVQRKWKKISRMNKTDLIKFKDSLSSDNQYTSKVYQTVINRIETMA